MPVSHTSNSPPCNPSIHSHVYLYSLLYLYRRNSQHNFAPQWVTNFSKWEIINKVTIFGQWSGKPLEAKCMTYFRTTFAVIALSFPNKKFHIFALLFSNINKDPQQFPNDRGLEEWKMERWKWCEIGKSAVPSTPASNTPVDSGYPGVGRARVSLQGNNVLTNRAQYKINEFDAKHHV